MNLSPRSAFGKLWNRFHDWGMTPSERSIDYPCDHVPNPPHAVYYRAMTVNASAAEVFPWYCQMRIAPYSYDWLDNLGRRSPQSLTLGLTELQIGQVFMTGFELVDFEHNCHVTLRSRSLPAWLYVFGDVVISYKVYDIDDGLSRMLIKMRMGYPQSPLRPLMMTLLPPGDTFMMHKQLRSFKRLAERSRLRLVDS